MISDYISFYFSLLSGSILLGNINLKNSLGKHSVPSKWSRGNRNLFLVGQRLTDYIAIKVLQCAGSHVGLLPPYVSIKLRCQRSLRVKLDSPRNKKQFCGDEEQRAHGNNLTVDAWKAKLNLKCGWSSVTASRRKRKEIGQEICAAAVGCVHNPGSVA